MANLLEKEDECVDGQSHHDHNQVKHLEVDKEGRPLAYEGVSLDGIFMSVQILIKVYDSLTLYVQFGVLKLGHRDPFLSPFLTSFLRL